MNNTLEARFLGRDNVVLDVWNYFCAHVVCDIHVGFVILCACYAVYI